VLVAWAAGSQFVWNFGYLPTFVSRTRLWDFQTCPCTAYHSIRVEMKKCSNPHENLHLYVFLYWECDGSIIFDGGRTAMRQISISTGESVIDTIQSQYQAKLYETLYDHVTLCGQHDSGISWLFYVHGTLVIDTLLARLQYWTKLNERLYTYVTLCGQHDSGTYCLVYIHCATVVGTPGHSLASHARQRDIVWKLGLCMIFVWGIWNKYQIWRVRTCMRWISLLNGLSGNV